MHAGEANRKGRRRSMTGKERREKIVSILEDSPTPIPGAKLGEMCGVSRQVVVQDIALLRSQGEQIDTTHYGYQIRRSSRCTRLVKVRHGPERLEEELTAIVDLGGYVEDVMVNHRTYGLMSAPLGIGSRRDIAKFMDEIESGKSSPLSTVTSGYHFHHISADDEQTLDEIEQALEARGFTAEVMPYEMNLV